MRTRPLQETDAEELTALIAVNRDHLKPWEPRRAESYFTVETQRRLIARRLTDLEFGFALPLVILNDDGAVAGQLNLNGITRGAFQSASLGYWVGAAHAGRGLATEAVADAARLAFTELGLHRLQAEALPHNHASRRVLARNGFRPYGFAPEYLEIDGAWRDHVLFQLLNPA